MQEEGQKIEQKDEVKEQKDEVKSTQESDLTQLILKFVKNVLEQYESQERGQGESNEGQERAGAKCREKHSRERCNAINLKNFKRYPGTVSKSRESGRKVMKVKRENRRKV